MTADGSHSLFSEEFGEPFHSLHGAIGESKHVYIEAGLHYAAKSNQQLSILEMGFGTGLNALLTMLAADDMNLKIQYTGIEAFPLEIAQVMQLNYPSLLGGKSESFFKSIHACRWGEFESLTAYFRLVKLHQRFEELDLERGYDLIYFDTFAPAVQSELWTEAVFRKMANSLRPGGILTTYCAKGSVRRALREVGFEVEKLPGPAGKREITRAIWR
jgi:tRNA U34 5-methylaminomethyl-2-thiouridine-forming methyltransferase MnmC